MIITVYNIVCDHRWPSSVREIMWSQTPVVHPDVVSGHHACLQHFFLSYLYKSNAIIYIISALLYIIACKSHMDELKSTENIVPHSVTGLSRSCPVTITLY